MHSSLVVSSTLAAQPPTCIPTLSSASPCLPFALSLSSPPSLSAEMALSQAYILLFILLIISFLAIVGCMTRLVLYTRENSISGMIAQRYNPLSYCCIIAIACFTMLTSATVLIGEVKNPPLDDCSHYQPLCSSVVWLNMWSPIICMCILFFPLKVIRERPLPSDESLRHSDEGRRGGGSSRGGGDSLRGDGHSRAH